MIALRQAFILTLPVLGAYWILGVTYGLLAVSMGYPLWIPVVMAMVVYSGSVEFLALAMLLGTFNPVAAFGMAFMVGARHIFYGISMLDSFRNAGWRKPFLIFWMSDETFAVNYSNGGSLTRQLWVSVLDYVYWIAGGVMGYCLGTAIGQDVMRSLKGLDFIMTIMFVVIFMDNYVRNPHSRFSSWLGIMAAVVCLMMFGTQRFIIPAMMCIMIALYIKYKMTKRKTIGRT